MASERQPQNGETSSVIAASHGAWLDSWQCWNNRATPTSRACNQWATAWAPTLAFETHDTNARRLTLTFETRDANARPHRPKTGPFTPAKAIPVSQPTPNTPAKAIPVSRKAEEHNPHHHHEAPNTPPRDLSTGVMLNASYPQGYNSSFSSRFQRAIIHQSAPYPQLQMVVSNCYLNSSHPSDLRFALLAFMERKYSCIASERTAMF